MKTALLFGATGYVGSFLLQKLLADRDYEKVIVVVRRKINTEHPKLEVVIGDFSSLQSLKGRLVASDVFLTLGTTVAATPNPTEYYQIDHDYPVLAAKLAKEQGASLVSVVTAVGTNANSPFSYVRTKGEVERDLMALNYPHTQIFRPSMILAERSESRPLEKFFLILWPLVSPLLSGPLNRYKGTHGKDIATAMIAAAKKPSAKVQVYHWQEMRDLTRA